LVNLILLFCATNFFRGIPFRSVPFRSVPSFGIGSSAELGMPRNAHFLPRNSGNRVYSAEFFRNEIPFPTLPVVHLDVCTSGALAAPECVHKGSELHQDVYTTGPCAASGLVYRGLYCTWSSLHQRGGRCTFLHYRDLCCIRFRTCLHLIDLSCSTLTCLH
jgi:hypothetical protein